MLKNYLVTALRSLQRKLSYSLINIIGLSTGLTCVLFIFSWVYDETSYDKHYPNHKDIYRVVAEAGTGEDRWHQAVTSLPLGPTIQNTYPEIKAMVRLDPNDAVVEKENDRFVEENILLTDPGFFELFNYRLIRGNEVSALSEPYQIVITQSVASKYFGEEDPLGKTLRMYMYDPDGTGMDYTITGIIADPPERAHFTFDILGSMSTIEKASPGAMDIWMNNSYYTYIELNENTDPVSLESKFPEMVDLHIGEQIEEFDLFYRFYLQPISSIHLYSDNQYEIMANGEIEYVWIFSAIGFLILALAIINYINLTISFSFDRTREVGIRKVMGALKNQLIGQHLTETLVLTILSILLAWFAIQLFKPVFHFIAEKQHILFEPVPTLISLLVIGIPIGLIAGYFPAKILAGIHTLKSLKGKLTYSSRNSFRSILVAFQFSVTLVIVVGLIVVKNQLDYVQSKDLGYDRENLMVLEVNGSDEVKNGFEPFKQELLSHPSIVNVARSDSRIAGGLGNSNGRVTHPDGEVQFEKIYRTSVDYDYLRTYGIELIAGRNLDPEIQSDSTEGFILNERAVEAFGWTPEQAIDKEMRFFGRDGRIIGVVNNFHFNTLRHEIEPVCLFIRSNFSRISVKATDVAGLESLVSSTWKKHFPSSIFVYRYQDQVLIDTYRADQRFGRIFNIFSVLSVLIAFLGLFALVGFNVQKKTKEIGIRKVLGASTLQVLNHISLDFVKIIGIAALVAIPFAWMGMNSWLEGFPYRITLSPTYFLLAGIALIAGALVIIVAQSLRSSLANPADTLKEE